MASLLVASCSPAPKKSESAETAAASSASPLASSAVQSAPDVPAPAAIIDPEHDTRPDRVKFDEFNARLQGQQDQLVAKDADFIASMRTAFQKGSQDGAKSALVAYANEIQSLLAAEPPLPKLAGCFGRATAPGTEARDAATTALTTRRDKVQALSAITFRPLILPDFASAVTDPAAGQQQADQIKATLAKASAAVAGCGAPTVGGARHAYARPYQDREAAGSTGAANEPTLASGPQAPAAPPGPPSAHQDQAAASSAPPHKPTFMERLQHAFRK